LSALAGKFNNLIKAGASKKVEPQVGFQPLTAIHLGGAYDGDPATGNGDMQNVKLFFTIAFFILLIAWVNYINLSTAYAMRRAKEVGIRKSIGAFKSQLMGQFMLESLLVNVFAALLAIAVAYLVLPMLNYIIGKELVFDLLLSPSFWIQFLGITVAGSLLSGVYPALVLSSFKPITMLKTGLGIRSGSFNLRRGLIVFQFILSLLLVSGTYLVYNQIRYMKNQDIGVDKKQILVVKEPQINLNFDEYLAAKELFKDKLKTHHFISAATSSTQIPGRAFNWTRKEIFKLGEPTDTKLFADIIYVDGDFLDTYAFELLAQDSISKKAITNKRVAFINEEAVQAYGFGSPEKAMHQKLILFRDTVTIAGVLKNFHWQSLRDAHTPVILDVRGGYRTYFSIKMNPSSIKETLEHVESTYHAIYPGNPFEYFFLDDDFNRQYQADLQFGNLFAAFSGLAILISCTGLFALVSFSATLRTKEIGIRKVLGASISHLMILLTKEYLVLLSIAIVVATPFILYFGRLWLNNYAFRTDIGLDLFIIPALILLLISLLTVCRRIYSTAKANPVNSLRTD
jgi:putative ABC transport system permease protein